MPRPPRDKAKPASPKAHAPAPVAFDVALVEQLAGVAARHDLAEVVVEHGEWRVKVSRHGHGGRHAPPPPPPPAAAPAPIAPPMAVAAPAPARADDASAVKSPMVGTAYLRPAPNAKPFIEVGSAVKAGDKVLLIEAMKTFNDIVAPRSGIVTAIYVEDAQPVEFGEPLLAIE